MRGIINFFIFAAGIIVLIAFTIVGVDYLFYLWGNGSFFIEDDLLLRKLVGTVIAAYVILFGKNLYNEAMENIKAVKE